MDITRIALQKQQLTLVVIAALFIAGIQSFFSIPRAQDPGFIIRAAQVVTQFPGASPVRVEELVTDKLEEKIRQLPELDFVSSESKTGVSIITVNIKESYDDMRPIWDALRRKVDEAAGSLPDGVLTPQVNDDFGDVYGLVYAITGDGYSYADIKKVADNVRDQLLLLEDVAKVDILGAQEERIYLEYELSRLSEAGLSPQMLSAVLSNRNIINPGGEVYTEFEKLSIEPSGNFDSVEELSSTLIKIPGSGNVITLGEVLTVNRGYLDPPSSLMTHNGDQAVGLAISLRDGGNITELGSIVRQQMADIIMSYPIGIEFNEVAFEADVVNQTVNQFVLNLGQAVFVVTIVMLAFLGWRTGFIVATLIPVTVAITFFLMTQFDIGLDQISLAALMIALGLLVDNAIVIAENIMVRVEKGESRMSAALSATGELKIPLLTSSLTTSAAFLPIFLAESALGEYTAPLFKVVTLTLFCSLFVALTVIPLLCVLFIQVRQEKPAGLFERVRNTYSRFLAFVLTHRALTLGTVAAVFVLAIMSFSLVPKLFFTSKADPIFTIELEFSQSTPIDYTHQRVAQLEQFINDELLSKAGEPGIRNWASFIGTGGVRFVITHAPKPDSSGYALLLVNTTHGGEIVDQIIARLEHYLLENFDDASTRVKKLENGTSVAYPVSIRISGQNKEKLFQLAGDVKRKLAQIEGTAAVTDNWGLSLKKVLIDIDSQRAERAGLTHTDIATSIQSAISGITLTEFRERDKVIPVVLRSKAASERDYSKVGSMSAINSDGVGVPIGQVSDPYLVFQSAQIFRRNGAKTIEVSANLLPGMTALEVNAKIAAWLEQESRDWPPGYSWEPGGEAESSSKANQSIGDKLPVAAFAIFIILMAQFNCIRRTFIILMTIPLALIGVVFGLLLMRSYFGFITLLGVISLAGIVINNAIVLLDRINLEHHNQGVSWQDAIIIAANSRLRPILLTTFTTVLGLTPLYLGGGSMWEPMAVTIIFGLLVSTVLTLGVVPVLFSLLFRVNYK